MVGNGLALTSVYLTLGLGFSVCCYFRSVAMERTKFLRGGFLSMMEMPCCFFLSVFYQEAGQTRRRLWSWVRVRICLCSTAVGVVFQLGGDEQYNDCNIVLDFARRHLSASNHNFYFINSKIYKLSRWLAYDNILPNFVWCLLVYLFFSSSYVNISAIFELKMSSSLIQWRSMSGFLDVPNCLLDNSSISALGLWTKGEVVIHHNSLWRSYNLLRK